MVTVYVHLIVSKNYNSYVQIYIRRILKFPLLTFSYCLSSPSFHDNVSSKLNFYLTTNKGIINIQILKIPLNYSFKLYIQPYLPTLLLNKIDRAYNPLCRTSFLLFHLYHDKLLFSGRHIWCFIGPKKCFDSLMSYYSISWEKQYISGCLIINYINL